MNTRVVVCQCAERNLIATYSVEKVLDSLRETRLPVLLVPDLCALAVDGHDFLHEMAQNPTESTVFACYPRAVRALLLRNEEPGESLDDLEVINLREEGWHEALEEFCLGLRDDAGEQDNGPRVAWYPLIDTDRCSECSECLEFCLFDVYSMEDDGSITVANPYACKDRCPACARVCALGAIIFPKHESPEIAGADVPLQLLHRAPMRVDIARLLGVDDLTPAQMSQIKETADNLGIEIVDGK